jgi:hypothetical protein
MNRVYYFPHRGSISRATCPFVQPQIIKTEPRSAIVLPLHISPLLVPLLGLNMWRNSFTHVQAPCPHLIQWPNQPMPRWFRQHADLATLHWWWRNLARGGRSASRKQRFGFNLLAGGTKRGCSPRQARPRSRFLRPFRCMAAEWRFHSLPFKHESGDLAQIRRRSRGKADFLISLY